ncbi:hypothetical protein K470DRAFT_257066 [Piedraia hortae CBS 480.64]|uniref:PB1 domain-containing protein n=1 Tax=Piedraia hortae CBS 480.64 TaxID=1314780 RepID=A0A6A7C1L7_9PEZI|nr:hypothetical protein K470DRAFT_257066 [Piedraia hortae CBS 480.64]
MMIAAFPLYSLVHLKPGISLTVLHPTLCSMSLVKSNETLKPEDDAQTSICKDEDKRVRLKISMGEYGSDFRWAFITKETGFDDLHSMVVRKFGLFSRAMFHLKVQDEEGDWITLSDDDDMDWIRHIHHMVERGLRVAIVIY